MASAPGESRCRSPRCAKRRTSSACRCSRRGSTGRPDIHFDSRPGAARPFHYFAFGAAVSEVEVDGFTGAVPSAAHRHPAGRRRFDLADRRSRPDRRRLSPGRRLAHASRSCCGTRKAGVAPAGASTYKLPSWSEMPDVFNVHFLERATQPGVVVGSKAVGEPPLMLAFSVREALRDAVAAFGDGACRDVRQSRDARARLLRRPRVRCRATAELRPGPDPMNVELRSSSAPPSSTRPAIRSSSSRRAARSRWHDDGGLLVRDGRIVAAAISRQFATAHPTRGHRLARRVRAARLRRHARALPAAADHRRAGPVAARLARAGRAARRSADGRPRLRRRTRPASFVHALASHGTTTALVFGAHFAGPRRRSSRPPTRPDCASSVRPGGVGSPAAARAAPVAGASLSRQH